MRTPIASPLRGVPRLPMEGSPRRRGTAAARGGLAALTLIAALAAQTEPAPVTEARVEAAAREVDRLVEVELARRDQRPNAITDDATFVRRAYLAIAGRIPTIAEIAGFQRQPATTRRANLIDALVGSPAHQSHLFNWWADLLRARTRLNRQVSGEPFMHWIKEALAANKPYDVFVTEMLVASGPAHQRGNGATGYHLRDLAMPEDDMANTMRLFLGTRLECAQCHNHPFDKWKQKDFYELVAFNGGMQYRTGFDRTPAAQALRESARKLMEEHGQRAQQALRQLVQTAAIGITGSGTGYARLPDNYQYADARPGQPVAASTPFGNDVQLDLAPVANARQPRRQPRRGGNAPVGQPADTRAAFAGWLTGPDNPRFATVIANRFWKRTFGRALIEPLDDLRDDTKATSPELMAYLAKLVVDLDFDLRAFERVLLRTKLFQREVTRDDGSEGEFAFAGPLLRRLSAEQMWDSLLVLVVPDLDATLRAPGARAEEVYARFEKVTTASPAELEQEVAANVLRQTDPQKYREMMRERAAQEMQAQDRQPRPAANDGRLRALMRDLAAARRRNDAEAEAKVLAELRAYGAAPDRGRRNQNQTLARASDLPSPAPAGHLLREFGQSDRETIEAAHTEASVPQVLNLLNGFVDQRVLDNRASVVRRAIEAEKDVAAKIETAFLSLLARRPTAAEAAQWRAAAAADSGTAMRDLLWVLLNSHEFRFLR